MSISITWLGHASFKIRGSQVLYIDPWKVEGAPHDGDLVLVSHIHNDHYSRTDIDLARNSAGIVAGSEDVIKQEGRGTAITPGSDLSLGGVQIHGVAAYNVGKAFHPKDNGWLGFYIIIDGIKLYYAGDTDIIPEMGSLPEIDIALLPVGGKYTMDAAEACEAASTIGCTTAIPYHWGDIIGDVTDAQLFKDTADTQVEVLQTGEQFSV